MLFKKQRHPFFFCKSFENKDLQFAKTPFKMKGLIIFSRFFHNLCFQMSKGYEKMNVFFFVKMQIILVFNNHLVFFCQ